MRNEGVRGEVVVVECVVEWMGERDEGEEQVESWRRDVHPPTHARVIICGFRASRDATAGPWWAFRLAGGWSPFHVKGAA